MKFFVGTIALILALAGGATAQVAQTPTQVKPPSPPPSVQAPPEPPPQSPAGNHMQPAAPNASQPAQPPPNAAQRAQSPIQQYSQRTPLRPPMPPARPLPGQTPSNPAAGANHPAAASPAASNCDFTITSPISQGAAINPVKVRIKVNGQPGASTIMSYYVGQLARVGSVISGETPLGMLPPGWNAINVLESDANSGLKCDKAVYVNVVNPTPPGPPPGTSGTSGTRLPAPGPRR